MTAVAGDLPGVCAFCLAENEVAIGERRAYREDASATDTPVAVVLGTPACAVHAAPLTAALVALVDRRGGFFVLAGDRAINRAARHRREREQDASAGVQLR